MRGNDDDDKSKVMAHWSQNGMKCPLSIVERAFIS